jgi:hypothetical protein
MYVPGGNKEEQTNSVITINHEAAKENFLLPWVLIILLEIINFLFFFLNLKRECRPSGAMEPCLLLDFILTLVVVL